MQCVHITWWGLILGVYNLTYFVAFAFRISILFNSYLLFAALEDPAEGVVISSYEELVRQYVVSV